MLSANAFNLDHSKNLSFRKQAVSSDSLTLSQSHSTCRQQNKCDLKIENYLEGIENMLVNSILSFTQNVFKSPFCQGHQKSGLNCEVKSSTYSLNFVFSAKDHVVSYHSNSYSRNLLIHKPMIMTIPGIRKKNFKVNVFIFRSKSS